MTLRHATLPVLLLMLLPGRAARADDAPTPPSEAGTRKNVDDLVSSFKSQKKKATTGMIEQAIGLSISFGAPTYNAGDHAACATLLYEDRRVPGGGFRRRRFRHSRGPRLAG